MRAQIKDYLELFNEFIKLRNDVNNVNRYIRESPILDLLYSAPDFFSTEVPQGRSFYRGRIFNLDDFITSYEEFIEWKNSHELLFQGFNREASGAPPSKSSTEGRLNGRGISFLYTCSDVETAIYELRPTKEEKISVAEFISQRCLNFADLTIYRSDIVEDRLYSDLLRLIAYEFSIPHYTGHNYSFTQYLAGQFLNLGFHGIIFKSSLSPSGENYVFFNPSDCKAINSRLYNVKSIKIISEPILRKDIARR